MVYQKSKAFHEKIRHVFVLMMENRSFDHMLGFDSIQGIGLDGKPTKAVGLNGTEANPDPNGEPIKVSDTAPDSLSFDPKHEFPNIKDQLCGPGGQYPGLTMDGFVRSNGSDVMRCFAPGRLKILASLAREFTLCDHWFSSLPGPTWPNRLFVHAATSGGLFCSPDDLTTAEKSLFGSYAFEHGTVYDALDKLDLPWRIYHHGIPQAITLAGMKNHFIFGKRFREFDRFAGDLKGKYPYRFTFIEPHYGGFLAEKYTAGNSQHPNGDIREGEKLIRDVYLALRNSPLWSSSLLLVTYDEHGGFYDHVKPKEAVPPGDKQLYAGENTEGCHFDFGLYGVRVPAVVISPWVAKGLVDHKTYDHSSVSRTLGNLFGFQPLTQRDGSAESLEDLFSLEAPRPDALADLPEVEVSQEDGSPSRGAGEILEGLDRLMLRLASGVEAHLDPHRKSRISEKVRGIQTRGQAGEYMLGVHQRVLDIRNANPLIKLAHALVMGLKHGWAKMGVG